MSEALKLSSRRPGRQSPGSLGINNLGSSGDRILAAGNQQTHIKDDQHK